MQSIKKIFKKIAAPVSPLIVWLILFFNYYLFRLNRSYLPSAIANLCFNDLLVFTIKPEMLKYHVSDPDILPEHLFIWSGDWDKFLIPEEEHEKIVMMRELFLENINYRDTQFYNYAVSKMKEGYPLKRGVLMLDSMANIEKYFEKQKKLFQEIKGKGFDLKRASNTGVVIDRDGNLIHFREGHHSLAIANILGVKKVNVKIRAVHIKWLISQLKNGGLNFSGSIKNGLRALMDVIEMTKFKKS